MNKEEKKALLSLPEYEFLKTDPNLRQGVCLLGLAGSHAYGTNVPTSDIDIRGIAQMGSNPTKIPLCYKQSPEHQYH